MQPVLTDYFPSHILPTREGVYEVKPFAAATGRFYARWSEKGYWGSIADSSRLADSISHRFDPNPNQQLAWRGIYDAGSDGDENGRFTV